MRNYPPEAIKSEGAGLKGYIQTPKSDLYMFALIMWEMLHAKLVWNQFNTAQANSKVLEGNLPDFEQSVLDTTPPEIIDFIKECLAHNPDQRPSFSEAAEKLREIYLKIK